MASDDSQRMEVDFGDEDGELAKRLAEVNARGTIELSARRIQCNDLFSTEGGLKADDKRLLNLECLDGLRGQDEFFFPSDRRLYIRDCMQDMLVKLTAEKQFGYRRVLIGSPGVGKSILFFLAALRRAQMIESDKKVVFLRRTKDDPFISVFCMEASEDDGRGSVKVFFSREVEKRRFNLSTTTNAIEDMFEWTDPKKIVYFVDGPRHNDNENTLRGTFDYLCTSGGYPVPKQEELTKIEVWILNGWKETEMTKALEQLVDVEHDEAVKIYELCGGSIRLALLAKKNGMHFVKDIWKELLDTAPQQAKVLAIKTNQRSEDPNDYDRMRTMFEREEGRAAIQLVDSQFLLGLLKNDASIMEMREAYQLATVVGLASVRGGLFEELMHQWFKTSKPGPVTTFLRSSGTGREGVSQFAKANMYWIPSVSNFANIDAAFVCGVTLVCLQYTVGQTHSFNPDSFKIDLIAPLVEKQCLSFKCIEIYLVVPTGTAFTNDHARYMLELSSPDANRRYGTRSAEALKSFEVVFQTIEVDPSNNGLIKNDIQQTVPCLKESDPNKY